MMNWKGCGKKWLRHISRYYPGIILEELWKIMEYCTTVSIVAEIQTGHLLNTSHKHYHFVQLAQLIPTHAAFTSWEANSTTSSLTDSSRAISANPLCCSYKYTHGDHRKQRKDRILSDVNGLTYYNYVLQPQPAVETYSL
jgi:hypothetical protein